MSDEKRAFIRRSIETPVTYTINDNDDNPHHGTSQNLSVKGLYMTTDFGPKLGDKIEVVLEPIAVNLLPLVAAGKVVRCRFDKKDADLFHVSIEFSEAHESWQQISATTNN
ncbi:MAG: hypothetical protein DRQ39_03875 [Gammaproteobacteria bacterium]|nr:MAG: hypothetical protein DRQ39_03875 [Gammaproteobacteria bacterium]RKZ98320.1 MAG: hypothetical protein DRQ46_02415 [Gammaproteobacteria bacterium]